MKAKQIITALGIGTLLLATPAKAQLTAPTSAPTPNDTVWSSGNTQPAATQLPTPDVSLSNLEADVAGNGETLNIAMVIGGTFLAFILGSHLVRMTITK
jgi:hypothetical protein